MRYCHTLPPTGYRNKFACCSFFCRHLLGTCSVLDIWACHSTTFFSRTYGFNSPPGQQQQTCFNSRLVGLRSTQQQDRARSRTASRKQGSEHKPLLTCTGRREPMFTVPLCSMVFSSLLTRARHALRAHGEVALKRVQKHAALCFEQEVHLFFVFDLLGLPIFCFKQCVCEWLTCSRQVL